MLTAYAARRRVSPKAVSKAVATGRLSASVVRDEHGQPKIADPDLADREWEANTRPRADRPLPAAPIARPPAVRPTPADETPVSSPADDDVPDYKVSRARREAAAARREAHLADMAALDLAERRGELVPADEVRGVMVDKFTTVKTRILGVPSRVAPAAAGARRPGRRSRASVS
jgi:hypothetical protein